MRAPARLPCFPTLAAAAWVTLSASIARADEGLPSERLHAVEKKDVIPAKTRERLEFAALPILAGSTDIGVQGGVAADLTAVMMGFEPYAWHFDGVVSASFKDRGKGLEVVQQSHDFRLDAPHLFGGKLRISPGVFYERTVNAGYFGIGNATQAIATSPDGGYGDRYQYDHREVRTRLLARTPVVGPVDVAYGFYIRHVEPTVYEDSKLDEDREAEDPELLIGLNPLTHFMASVGANYNTRDSEIFPRSGSFHSLALRIAAASPVEERVSYGGGSLFLRKYIPLSERSLVAMRLVIDASVGRVPFYDLSAGGGLLFYDLPGGSHGIRGVPNGRFSGLLKGVANLELRSMLFATSVFGQRLRFGTNLFFDAGRVFTDYTFTNSRDGSGPGLAWGAGGGILVIIQTAAVVRLEVAYAPEASAANAGFPIGIYVQDGVMF